MRIPGENKKRLDIEEHKGDVGIHEKYRRIQKIEREQTPRISRAWISPGAVRYGIRKDSTTQTTYRHNYIDLTNTQLTDNDSDLTNTQRVRTTR